MHYKEYDLLYKGIFLVAHLVLQLQLEEIVEVGKLVNEGRVHGGDCLLVD